MSHLLTLTDNEAAAARSATLTELRRPLDPQPPSAELTRAQGQSYAFDPAVSKAIPFYSQDDYASLPKEPGVFDVYGSCGFVRDNCGQITWECPFGVPGDVLALLTPERTEYRIADIRVERRDGTGEWEWILAIAPHMHARGFPGWGPATLCGEDGAVREAIEEAAMVGKITCPRCYELHGDARAAVRRIDELERALGEPLDAEVRALVRAFRGAARAAARAEQAARGLARTGGAS